MMKRTGTALFLVLTMLCTLLGGAVSAQAAEADVWDGNIETGWYDSGNPQDSYDIATAAQLAGFAQLVNSGVDFSGATITLTADIDLNYLEWTPIGTSTSGYLKDVTFDGGGHRIHQMKITSDNYYSGFFGNLRNCVIQDLGVTDADITASHTEIGVLAGGMYNTSFYRCYTTGTITVPYNQSRYAEAVGGLVGFYYNAAGTADEIRECYSTVDITSENGGQFGGLVGWASAYEPGSLTIADCYYGGNLSVSDAESATGGIAGLFISISGYGYPNIPKGEHIVENCYVSGTVENTGDPDSAAAIGFIDGTVDNCHWNGANGIEGVISVEWDHDNGDFIDGDPARITNSGAKTLEDMSSPDFAALLNNGREEPVWGSIQGGTPMLRWQLRAYDADYSAVDAALAKVPSDLSLYTEETAAALQAAIDAVIRGKTADEQHIVDGYAEAIETAIANLVLIETTPEPTEVATEAETETEPGETTTEETGPAGSLVTTSSNPKTGDVVSRAILFAAVCAGGSAGVLLLLKKRNRI